MEPLLIMETLLLIAVAAALIGLIISMMMLHRLVFAKTKRDSLKRLLVVDVNDPI
jgi:hypothetical protein